VEIVLHTKPARAYLSRNTTEKTIEGDLFTAFVAAGAISKANADDPKKSQLVRCARTDKGVHAAGNVISLKLIVEDKDIVQKINEHLSPQIRVWGYERTVNSFSCYQACDSRWYEYLLPTHALLPPHPSSFLGRMLPEHAEKAGDMNEYLARQAEVADFWTETEENYVKQVLESMNESTKALVMKALYEPDSDIDETPIDQVKTDTSDAVKSETADTAIKSEHEDEKVKQEGKKEIKEEQISTEQVKQEGDQTKEEVLKTVGDVAQAATADATTVKSGESAPAAGTADESSIGAESEALPAEHRNAAERKKDLDAAIKQVRIAYMNAKRAYRISDARKQRVADALKLFLGTCNFHNYTVEKGFRDPSAQRHIKSFTLNPTPIVINGTEWLSIKVHGQSFMMHQIRKMISMIALTIRCGCPLSRITESFKDTTISIPKVPGLGLLLERPVFESYNEGAASKFDRERIDFTKYEKEMEEFKRREIYDRIFREEAETNAFHTFFAHVDSFREGQFLYLTSMGLEAVKGLSTQRGGANKGKRGVAKSTGVDSDDDAGDAVDS